MTDIDTEAVELGDFEGRPITKTTVIIRKTGDGLSEAMTLDPVELHTGQRVRIVLEALVGPIRFDPILEKGEDTGNSERKHIMDAEVVTLVDWNLVGDVIERQRGLIETAREEARLAREAAKGVKRLPNADDEADEAEVLAIHHGQGLHADGLVDGCPDCTAELEAEEDEATGKAS